MKGDGTTYLLDLAFFPGKYTLQVNHTPQEFEVKPGAVTEVQAGVLTVPGSTDEYYYVLDSTGTELDSHCEREGRRRSISLRARP